jgi:apolipoprotein N-acyltransferase
LNQRWSALLTFAFAHPGKLALLLGALAASGFQPLALWPLALLAMAGLIELIARAPSSRQAARLGWLFGIGHFTLGNAWIATAFTYQAKMPGWLGWLAVAGLALYLAVYPALAALGGHWLGRSGGLALAFGFAASWIVAEWLRGWMFTGFAWNPFGVILLGPFDSPGLARLLPWMGTYALSGLAVLLAGGLWLALKQLATTPHKLHPGIGLTSFAAVLTAAIHMPLGLSGDQGTLPYTLVQPDVRQDDLYNPALYETHFARTAALSLPREPGQRRIVLWPESGVPDYLRDGYPAWFYLESTYGGDPLLARRRIGRVAGSGALLLTGADDLEVRGQRAVGARNSVTAIDADGRIVASYAKAHLVPYGEYLPLRGLLEPLGLARLVPGDIDFWPGPGPRTLDLKPWGKVGVQICYEIVFSGEVVDPANRPDFLFNPSNDGWFGASGPPQHLAQARLRAIEEGLPVLRATTTGISAVIDAEGVVRQYIPRHTAGRLDGLVPPAHSPTSFARAGNMLALGWAAALLLAALVARRRARG